MPDESITIERQDSLQVLDEKQSILRAQEGKHNTLQKPEENHNTLQTLEEIQPVYLHDGTLEGLFSAIFASYARHEQPAQVTTPNGIQTSFFLNPVSIPTCEEHAIRVRTKLLSTLGPDEYERIKGAFLSDSLDKDTIIYRFVRYAMRVGRKAIYDSAHPDTAAYSKLWREVYTERHRMLQFLRFSEMQNGVFFAKINPKANVVPLIMEHFSKRYNTQPFLIYDEVHHIAGLYDLQSIQLVSTDTLTLPELDPQEEEYRELWRTFYDSICNTERLNPALRRSFMPKRLWGNLTELNRQS